MRNISLFLLMSLLMAFPLKAGSRAVAGDMDGNGILNISDVTLLISYVLNDGSGIPTADVNQDGAVNISDVTQLIEMVLNDTGGTPTNETFTVNGVSFTMVYVEGGTFQMGATGDLAIDAFSNEYPIHDVTLSSFYMGETEVTQALWTAVMGSNPSYFQAANGFAEIPERPVECVNWADCHIFISKLNELTGREFRLPTEAEWEFAARGGNLSQGYLYSGSNNVNDVAWWQANAGYRLGTEHPDFGAHAVATKMPNELGLYDMSGNVFEWCIDWYADYTSEPQTNPTGPATGSYRVFRGGYWSNLALKCRVSFRHNYFPSYRKEILGVRLAM